MSTPMDHIAYLSQEIGPRPAGTEEEQQAALYITERFQKDAHLSAQIEDFNCNSDALMTPIICFAVAVFAVILGVALPSIAIVAFVLGLAAAAVYACEQFDHPLLSQVFTKGVSQNVVAKYEPTRTDENATSRRRKVILVANYDSGRVRRETSPALVRALRPLKLGALGGMAVASLLVLIRGLAFPAGGVGIFFAVLAVLCVLPAAVLLVFAVMERGAHYTEAANNNASGVAVMLEVARRLGNGEVVADVPEQTSLSEAAALSYNKPSIGDLSDNLVNLNAAPIATYAADNEDTQRASTKAAFAAQEAPQGENFSSAITSEMPKIGENGEAPVEEAKPIDEIAEQVQHITVETPAEEPVVAEAAIQAAVAVAPAAAAVAVQAANEDNASTSVPDWYRKATQKAREKKNAMADADETPESSYRSRFADFPDGSRAAQNDEAEQQPVVQEAVASQEVVEEPSPVVEEASVAETQPQAEVAPVADAPASQPVQPAMFPAEATSAMSPVQAGNLDLEAMRAAASAETANAAAPASQPAAYQQPEPIVTERVAEPQQPWPARNPQTMYYTQPEDRSDIQAERAKVDRVTVSADEFDAVAGSPASMNNQTAFEVPQVTNVPALNVPSPVEPAQAASAPARSLNLNIPVVDIPSIELPSMDAPEPKPITFNELRQRAPLAQDDSAASAPAQSPARSLNLNIPAIDSADAEAGATVAMSALPLQPQMGYGAYEVEPTTTNTSVSLTGSFAAIGSIGAQPVGDELLEGVDPNDIYVEDAEDTIFDEEYTATGAYAGEGYVDMPKSRVSKFFGRFRKNKKEEQSASEWLGVDENFDARSVGKARGGWDSFRDEEDDWNGGAFSNLRARVMTNQKDEAPAGDDRYADQPAEVSGGYADQPADDVVSSDAFASAYEAALRVSGASAKAAVEEEMQQIYSFASGDINTEVWFVALGSELADNGGIKAFLAEHANDMRGAIIVNLEGVGAGKLSYLESEGVLQPTKCPPRVKRFIKKAMQASGVQLDAVKVNWKESAASFAAKHRMQAVTIAGMDGEAMANYAQAGDVVESIDQAQVDKAADFVVELLKNI